ncbi:LLM class F420-dependent oxidoreductase [Spirilliplanes yamanashiensis]|uniref:LLM class F420-dependent oxidoreductase n=1 Tax=Spirilliplanes yamanashiensis TaxID=42233 RepID=A0A8J3YCC2_9ACTN|nr:LLM class F420-dependent oxidoreductase [Spirilliplanes yamanashiensis]MDP9818835.1 F420-dependent oxidoreductase-like protein [Spirilliplanes yamanashiensis]GIJ05289.1 LLM class F420-dependent oxidoreductase [Spirilliplanes yamanashiensis]
MKLGLHISNFTWPDGAPRLADVLAEIGAAADDAGFDRISVMDHLWQIEHIGPPEHEMLEAYTALGFLAAHTSRAKLLTLVSGVTYRDPGMLAKMVTTLDVLSKGRAMLGIGAAWNADESRGLGLFFPPTKERFERLEETLQICLRMFHGDETPYAGRHYTLHRPLNSPAVLSRPHPPILIGGGGEQKTLKFVARYADACNLFPGPQLEHKLDVLKRHCEAEGRDYDTIEKTVMVPFDLGDHGERVKETIDTLRDLAARGFTVGHGSLRHAWKTEQFQLFRDEIVPAAAEL